MPRRDMTDGYCYCWCLVVAAADEAQRYEGGKCPLNKRTEIDPPVMHACCLLAGRLAWESGFFRVGGEFAGGQRQKAKVGRQP